MVKYRKQADQSRSTYIVYLKVYPYMKKTVPGIKKNSQAIYIKFWA